MSLSDVLDLKKAFRRVRQDKRDDVWPDIVRRTGLKSQCWVIPSSKPFQHHLFQSTPSTACSTAVRVKRKDSRRQPPILFDQTQKPQGRGLRAPDRIPQITPTPYGCQGPPV